MAILAATGVCFGLQKVAMGYTFGFQGVGFRADNPHYMISKAIPELIPNYAAAVSMSYTFSYAFGNLILSFISKKWDKKFMLFGSLAMMGLTSVGISFSTSALAVGLFRLAFGAAASSMNPPIYQLISE